MEDKVLDLEKQDNELQQLPVAVFDADLQGGVTFVNAIGLKLLGYSREEMLGRPFFKFIAPVDRNRCVATARNVMSEKFLGDNEFAITKRDGTLMSAFIQTMPRKNKMGELIGLRAVVVQIGREKSTEAVLFASEEKYRTLVNNIKLGVTRGTRGPDAKFIEVNKAVEALSGYSREELLSMQISDLFIDENERENVHINVEKNQRIVYQELRLRKKDGSEILVSGIITPVKDPQGDILCLDGILEDITERKQAEKSLRDSERKYRSLVNNIKLGIFRTTADAKGKVLEINRAIESITGYFRDELLAMPVCELYYNPEDRRTFLDRINSNPQRTTYEYAFIKKDRTKIMVSITAAAVRDDNGKILYLDGILEDISDRKMMEEQMRDLYEKEKSERLELQEEARTRNLFIDILAHELRTPLTPILASSSMLQDLTKPETDSLQKRLILNIESGAETLACRLEELLDLARYSRGTFKLNRQPIEIKKCLEKVIFRFAPSIEQHHQQLTVEISQDFPEVEADASRLEQVVVNLLSNASKFCPEKGHISFRAFPDRGEMVIEVEDDGIGISFEEQKKLFQPYHRVEQDRLKFPGMGLGLAVSRQIVEAHGGTIRVNSELGRGSKFSVRIPLIIST